ncbi:MAG: tyrosine-type recombinase/integrase [Gammaproteobacteria bacterium]|nr:tyrosine-type recombinase/integrase [Gammaproteobacteria bacterium]
MNTAQQKKFNSLYHKHVSALRRQGKAERTIDSYSRAVRRIAEFWDACPDTLTEDQLETYFSSLVETHSWSTVKVDRNGLQFFYQHVLKRDWVWVNIVKPPRKKVLPDILTLKEIERLINGTRELRYQTFILVSFSMGLRLGEALNLQVGDIDGDRMKVHIRQGKGAKDRFVTLPEASLMALRRYWVCHRNPTLLFPRGRRPQERAQATVPMDRGGLQKSFKVILQDCGIRKAVTIHTLRHCYGAHLVEAGVNLRAIQHEMGHECPKTTALYTQLTEVTQTDTDKRINRLVSRMRIRWGD